MTWLLPGDLAPFKLIPTDRAAEMIADVEALAVSAAPELAGELTPEQKRAVKAILRAAVLRWDDAGSGALQQQTAGMFGMTVDTRQGRYGQLWPSEEAALQRIVKSVTKGKAFVVEMGGAPDVPHAPWCAWLFGAGWCSCGADIAGQPIYEGGPDL